MSAMLRVENLTRRFGGLLALDCVSIEVAERAMHGIIGIMSCHGHFTP